MKSAIFFILLGTLVSTGTYAIPVSSCIEDYTDRCQELINHLANLKAHAVFVQNLLDQSKAQVVTEQTTFGDKEAEAVLAAAKSLPPRVLLLEGIKIAFAIIRTIVIFMVGCFIGKSLGSG